MLPRLVLPAFWLAWLLLLPARGFRRRKDIDSTRLAIESGRIGWTHVFFEELHASAREYLDGSEVERLVIDRDEKYRPQFRAFLDQTSCTHLLIDVRTGPQDWWGGIGAALAVAWKLNRRDITPIVVLADASLRRHRLQAAILTAFTGVVVTFMATALVRPMFPHRRIIGPLPMPVSVSRLEWLDTIQPASADAEATVAFIGSVYPPRAQFLGLLSSMLAEHGVELRINADKYGTSNDDYWRVLATSDVIVTTTLQGMPRPAMDWIWNQQMVFRFSEALSARAVLVAPAVVGIDEWLKPGTDFVPFVSVADACDRIIELVGDRQRRAAVSASGHRRASTLARGHAFWVACDGQLGRRPLRSVASA